MVISRFDCVDAGLYLPVPSEPSGMLIPESNEGSLLLTRSCPDVGVGVLGPVTSVVESSPSSGL